ncbi:MAG TPA: ASKHA domain-containing protein, partial [Anaerolineales bacterium]|nr:ASKHA domain-containing protein [Anaerolineales bacterium]
AAQLVAVLPSGSQLLGLAVDIGTTKLAAYLVDLETGQVSAKAGAMNPQIGYGEDVISRIAYTLEHPDGAAVLQARLVQALNQLVKELCSEVGARSSQVVEAVLVGNTAMHHLCARLPVRQLGLSPYVPVIGEALELRASEIGLELSSGARVYLPPNIAGYVGADHVAMLLAMDMGHKVYPTIALDIGTNTEITLAVPQGDGRVRMLSCSCASGPAFEGAHIRHGMRAAPGAIERVQLIDGQVYMKTIGKSAPVGICGSGILDTIAALRAAAILDRRGVFQENHPSVRRTNGKLEFVLAPKSLSGNNQDITVSREDVNEIQLAKGAIRAGVEILLDVAGLEAKSLQEFIVAGAFGTYLDLESAIQVGMFPALPRERYRQVGNAAGAGARQLLVSVARRHEAARLARQVEYIELTNHRSFTDAFVKALIFEV